MINWISDFIDDNLMKILIVFGVLVLILAAIASYKDFVWWDQFKVDHDCVETGTRTGSPTYVKSGDVLIPIENIKHVFKCNDGKEYLR